MKTVVIIPALNEAESIAEVIQSIPQYIGTVSDILTIVIDDGSTDNTVDVARKAGADYILRHRKNRGVGAAIKTGISKAVQLNADIVCMVDADGQFDLSELPSLINPIIQNSADMVIGSRLHRDKASNGIPIVRRLFNTIVALVVSVIIAKRITDAECGFRALSGKAARNLELLGRFTFTHDMLIDLASKHFRIAEIPVTVKYFEGRESRAVRNLVIYGIGVLGVLLAKTVLAIKNTRLVQPA
jgi:glycosyltransferase involved in cell wall biosynthesis